MFSVKWQFVMRVGKVVMRVGNNVPEHIKSLVDMAVPLFVHSANVLAHCAPCWCSREKVTVLCYHAFQLIH